MTRVFGICASFFISFASFASGQTMPAEYQQVLTTLNRQGDYAANVLKVNIPRDDLSVTVAGVKTPTPFGFGGWVAMTKGDGDMHVLMGDLVLTQDEVNPVMSALLDNSIEVTALHNHFFSDEPRMFYMHVHGMGTTVALTTKLRAALAMIGKRAVATPASATAAPAIPAAQAQYYAAAPLDTAAIDKVIGHTGEQTGVVYKITVGREDLAVKEMGATINARMGLNTWAAFVGTDANAAMAGDVAMLAQEVTPVLRALRQNGLEVVAIHHHMTNTQPTIFFVHYWGTGRTTTLAAGFKAALDQLGKSTPSAPK